MDSNTVIQTLLSGSFLVALGGILKYLVETYRTGRAQRTPLAVANSSSDAAAKSVEIMSRVNGELDTENARLRTLLQASELARDRERAEHVAREAKLRGEIVLLEARVRELEDAAASLARDVSRFKNREFPRK